jgi:hypothetical protein
MRDGNNQKIKLRSRLDTLPHNPQVLNCIQVIHMLKVSRGAIHDPWARFDILPSVFLVHHLKPCHAKVCLDSDRCTLDNNRGTDQ